MYLYTDFLERVSKEWAWDHNKYYNIKEWIMTENVRFCFDNGYIVIASSLKDHRVYYHITWKGLWHLYLHRKSLSYAH
jgi:hypothetical protein